MIMQQNNPVGADLQKVSSSIVQVGWSPLNRNIMWQKCEKNHSLNLVPNLELLLFYQEGWQIRVFCYDS